MAVLRSASLKLLLATLLLVSHLGISEARGMHRLRIARNVDSDIDDVSADMKKLDDDDLAMGDEGSEFLNDDDTNYSEGDEDEEERGPEPFISTKSKTFSLAPGSNVLLPCDIENDDKEVIIWKKGEHIIYQDQIKVKVDDRINLFSNHTLLIMNVQADDAGEYICNLVGLSTITHTLKLFTEPKILKMTPEDKNRLVQEGSTLKVECITSGEPKPELMWSRGGERITNAVFEGDSVIINNVEKSDSGTYQCLASNGIGIPAHSAVNIKVLYAPIIKVKKSMINTDEGYDAQLTCTVNSEPRSNIIWEKDGKKITDSLPRHHIHLNENGNQLTLKITNIKHEDFGKYFCKAENVYGKGHGHTAIIKEPAKAHWAKDTNDDNLMDDNKPLKWVIESIQPLTEIELKYLKIDETRPDHSVNDVSDEKWIIERPVIQEPNGNEYTIIHILKGLSPGKYAAKIRSRNSHGWSEISEPFFFDGDFMSNEIRVGEQTGEAPVAEVGTGVANHISSSLAVVLISSTFLYCLV